jgi:hypothetical protein|tara:strand:+ start:482 stop:796 length:315 start_codon:yes stop_codon:yes gene_type:complete
MEKIIILPIFLLLGGCQNWLTITAVEQKGQLYFESQELSEQFSDGEIFISNAEVRTQAQILAVGQYHISGNISCSGADIGRVFGDFSIELAQNGAIQIENINSN